jgi:hypothetical protein
MEEIRMSHFVWVVERWLVGSGLLKKDGCAMEISFRRLALCV